MEPTATLWWKTKARGWCFVCGKNAPCWVSFYARVYACKKHQPRPHELARGKPPEDAA